MLRNFNYFVWELEKQNGEEVLQEQEPLKIKKLLYRADYTLLQETLNDAKNKMEFIDSRLVMKYYPLDKLKFILRNSHNIPYVTNAWLKTYEIFYNLRDVIMVHPRVCIFFNANAPGASTEAVKYLINILSNIDDRYRARIEWLASTMISQQRGKNDTLLGDTYGLIAKYRDNWLMNEDNNGDVTNVDNINNIVKQIRARFNKLADVYFSDIAIDVGTNYNEEELLESKQVLGQNITGLMCLNRNGTYIIKRRGMLLPISIWFLGLIYTLFHKVQILKPYSSKPCNSEHYIIGIGFKGISPSLVDTLLSTLVSFNIKSTPYKNPTYIDISVQYMIKQIATDIVINQVESIDSIYNAVHIGKTNVSSSRFNSDMNKLRYKWIADHKIKKLNP